MPKSANKAQLIAEIYEMVLKPESYDGFMELWEKHLSTTFSELEMLHETDISVSKHIQDPELEAHFQRAYEILEKLGREGKDISTPEQFATQKKEPAFFIAANKKIIHENKPAKQLLGDIVSFNGLSSLIDKKDYESLYVMLLGLERPDAAEQVHIFNLTLSPSTPTGKNKAQLFLAKTMRFAHNQPALLCLYAIGLDWDKGVEILLIDAFALSASELQIGRGLCEGKSLNAIANERKRSVHTIRTQVKSMLHKTGTNSQADLVRIIVTLTAFGRRQKFKLAKILNSHETSERIMIPLNDGRDMPVYLGGASNGRPVLFVHGMIDGYDACKFSGKLLVKNNIKLIAPVRPSFSDSPPAYGIKTAPEEFAADLQQIMDYLEIDSVPIIGHMAGSLYAFAAAAILQERISGILSISGVTPIKSFHEILSMSPRQRVVAWTARFAPNLLPTILRAGISQIDRGLEVEFMNALYAKGSKDREVAQNVDISTAIHAGYQFVIAQGHRAFEVDSHHVTRDWSNYMESVHQRVILAHGTLDQTIKIKTVREFANLYDNVELVEHDDAGQLVFYQKPDVIISKLIDLLD